MVTMRFFEVMKVFQGGISSDKSDVSDIFRVVEVLDGCDIVAVRSSMEFEPEWLRVLEDLHRKPVLPVGQLPTVVYDNGDETETWLWMKDWLDKQAKGSVVFVAFGSEAKPSQEELTEIALGLEQSKLPLFLVPRARPRTHEASDDESKEEISRSGAAGLAEEDDDVGGGENADVAVEGVDGGEEGGADAEGDEGLGDLLAMKPDLPTPEKKMSPEEERRV
ncbi:hypothetical protein SO802_004909 [Lithocarpus litseifolius]|uniref:Uncharacterized protein n=1 Tax=Lithocarpus litseifolius TaxID=425828 RepID=A0AAW2DM82_9ROSI